MSRIFVSYRRGDSQHAVDRLHQALRGYVENPDEEIFIDVDGIPYGVDFVKHLEAKIGECEILLAVIGPSWLGVRSADGTTRRLDDPKDFVRLEIAAALRRNVRVVPVLLDGARPPTAAELPDELAPLATRNAAQIDRLSFESDVERLARGLGLSQPGPTPESPTPRKKGGEPPPIIRMILALILVAGIGFEVWRGNRSDPGPQISGQQTNLVVDASPTPEPTPEPTPDPTPAAPTLNCPSGFTLVQNGQSNMCEARGSGCGECPRSTEGTHTCGHGEPGANGTAMACRLPSGWELQSVAYKGVPTNYRSEAIQTREILCYAHGYTPHCGTSRDPGDVGWRATIWPVRR